MAAAAITSKRRVKVLLRSSTNHGQGGGLKSAELQEKPRYTSAAT